MPWSCLQSASPIEASLLPKVSLRPSPQRSKSRRLPTFEWTRQADALALYGFVIHTFFFVSCFASCWHSSACHEVEPWAKLKKNTSDEEKSLALRELLVMAEGALRGNSGVSFWWPGDWDDLEGNRTYWNIFEHIWTPWIWPSGFQRFWCRCSHLRCASFSCHTGTKRKDSGRVRSWPRRVMASHTWHGVTGLAFAAACCIGI